MEIYGVSLKIGRELAKVANIIHYIVNWVSGLPSAAMSAIYEGVSLSVV
jgi:hypothetical protein